MQGKTTFNQLLSNSGCNAPEDVTNVIGSFLPLEDLLKLIRHNVEITNSIWRKVLEHHHPQYKDISKDSRLSLYQTIGDICLSLGEIEISHKYHMKGLRLCETQYLTADEKRSDVFLQDESPLTVFKIPEPLEKRLHQTQASYLFQELMSQLPFYLAQKEEYARDYSRLNHLFKRIEIIRVALWKHDAPHLEEKLELLDERLYPFFQYLTAHFIHNLTNGNSDGSVAK